jgi:ribosomal RNA-processing protein 12
LTWNYSVAERCHTHVVTCVYGVATCAQLAAEQDGVRYGTSQALRALIRSCISEDMVVAAVAARNLQQQQMEEGGPKGRPVPASPLQSVIVALASALGAQYREGWEHALPGEGDRV